MKMLKFLSLITLIPIFSSFDPCHGVERWTIKTLQDAQASSVNFMPITNQTVGSLIEIPTDHVGTNTPRHGVEFNTYTLKVNVKEYLSEGDKDIHIVITDINDDSKHMIAEIPDYSCDNVSTSTYVNTFKKVRDKFLSYNDPNNNSGGSRIKHLKSGVYTITGVAFIDLKHGNPQRGLAPNALELHPVLDFHN